MPAAVPRREHQGAAAPATLTASISTSDLALAISANSGWPTGSVGPFFVVIDPGTASEEKVNCTAQGASIVTVAGGGRGADGTTAKTHAAGAVVYPVWTATEADELNAHANATQQVHGIGVADSVVGTATAQTLTNKTISGASNTLSAIPKASVTGAPAGAFVGTTDVQTLSGKTFSDIITAAAGIDVTAPGGAKLVGDIPTSYPVGISTAAVVSANGWPFSGVVLTINMITTYVVQYFANRSTDHIYKRGSTDGTTWSTWAVVVTNDLAATLTNKTINSASNTLTVAQSAVTNLVADLAAKAALTTDITAWRKYINKAADETVTSNAAVQDDNHFAGIAFGASEEWEAEITAEFTSASNTPDMQCDWAVTGTVTVGARHILSLPTAETTVSGATTVALQTRDSGDDVSSAVVIPTGTTRSSYREKIRVSGGGSGGTLTFRWAQNTSDPAGTTMEANTSWFTARRLA